MTASLQAPVLFVARALLSLIFILSGVQKITGYSGTAGYMEMMGVPSILLPIALLVEVGGGLALLVGWQTRLAALALAGFSVVAGYLFHWLAITGADAMADMTQQIMFMKNVTIAGGMLAIIGTGPGAWSLDARTSGKPALA
jgi:putative oxidoreductase